MAENIEFKHKLDDISQILLKTSKETRQLIFELSSPTMNEIGLGAAITEWAEEMLKNSPTIDFELVEDTLECEMDNDLRAILFRNVREVLTNTIKHSRASKVKVTLKNAEGELRITVRDDGVGFDPKHIFGHVKMDGGFGLFSVQERMADLGGKLQIESVPYQGCTMIMSVPCSPKNRS